MPITYKKSSIVQTSIPIDLIVVLNMNIYIQTKLKHLDFIAFTYHISFNGSNKTINHGSTIPSIILTWL